MPVMIRRLKSSRLINLICTILTVIGAAVSAVASVVALLLTEDFTLPMRMVDRYTILMDVILAVCAATMLLHRRFNRGQEEESEE